MGNKIEEIEKKAKEISGGNYYYEQGFIYGFELGEENGRKELEKENEKLKVMIKLKDWCINKLQEDGDD